MNVCGKRSLEEDGSRLAPQAPLTFDTGPLGYNGAAPFDGGALLVSKTAATGKLSPTTRRMMAKPEYSDEGTDGQESESLPSASSTPQHTQVNPTAPWQDANAYTPDASGAYAGPAAGASYSSTA